VGGGWSSQEGYSVRFEWGAAGASRLAPSADVVVVVDVLRFTTAVDVAVSRGAEVFPYRWRDASATAFAQSRGAELADGSRPDGPSLSPARLASLARGDRVVLPSPNGSTCCVIASEQGAEVVAACLRNAGAVAASLRWRSGAIAVIACGELWPDGSLRPCLEDLLGAGAVIARLSQHRSPEAEAAAAAFLGCRDRIGELVSSSVSGRELAAKGRGEDLAWAIDLDASACVPGLQDGRFSDLAP
jgi:2-phosphosulfolactate phosphatase